MSRFSSSPPDAPWPATHIDHRPEIAAAGLTSTKPVQSLRPGSRPDSVVALALPWLPFLSATSEVRLLGIIGLALVVVSLGLVYLRRGRGPRDVPAYLMLSLILIGIPFTHTLTAQTAIQVAQLVIVALVLRIAPSLRIRSKTASISALLCSLLSCWMLLEQLSESTHVFTDANVFGAAAFCWAVVILKFSPHDRSVVARIRQLGLLVPPAVVILLSGSRGVMGAIIITIVYAFVIRHWIHSRRLRWLGAATLLVAPAAFLWLIANARLFTIADWIPRIGGKSAFSGRNLMWSALMDVMRQHSFHGFGLGALPGEIFGGNYYGLSAHNGFLQVLYQFGWIGLVIFVLALGLFLLKLSKRRDGALDVGIMAGAIFNEMFEVVLIQNAFGAGILIWLIAALPTPAATKHQGTPRK